MASVNNSYNPRNWQLNHRTIIGFINGAVSGFFLPTTLVNIHRFYTKDLMTIKKNSIENSGKFGHVLFFGTFALAAAMPFIILLALKQGMQCDWSKIVSSPAFLEALLSGIIVSVSLPNLFFKAIPRTLKAYSDGIFKTLFSKFDKVIKNNQELVKEFTDKECENNAKDMSECIKGEENAPRDGYQNAPDDIKQSVDNNIYMPIPENLTAQDLQNNIQNNPNLDEATKNNYIALVNDIKASYQDIKGRVTPFNEGTNNLNRQKNEALAQSNSMSDGIKKEGYENSPNDIKQSVDTYEKKVTDC
ncbi:unnamed protein product [Brachionus calyciflorus]|uniref:Uncharacterized protein n=1 Tax=Brachionus calyciflorus TaxID=104777 RepID=A0A814GNW0_9BILA|nr:unnamed protein product [Brachionus calyciflorus]